MTSLFLEYENTRKRNDIVGKRFIWADQLKQEVYSTSFATDNTLGPSSTFTRASVGTYVDANGRVAYTGLNEPRFTHDPETGESLGLLLEEERTNLLLHSNDFTQSNWIAQNSHPSPTPDIVGPDGVSNSGLRFYRTTEDQYIYQQVVGGGTYTLSAWIRSEASTGSFTMQGYNEVDGVMGTSFMATDQWKLYSITISPTITTNYYLCIPTHINTSFYVSCVQVEQGAFATSYIPTTTSISTRAADSLGIRLNPRTTSPSKRSNEVLVTKVYKKYSTSTYYSVDYVYTDGLKGSEDLDTFLQITVPVDSF
jgi:hypothetical protein